MYKEEVVLHKKKKIALIFRGFPDKQNSYFLTPIESFLQLGFHKSTAAKSNEPHFHKAIKTLNRLPVYEILIILKGSLKITFYSKDKKMISKHILKKNDGVLIMEVIHSVTFSKQTRILEIKQGPYTPQ